VIRLSSTNNAEITGILAQESGRYIQLFNVGTFDIKLKANNANSSAANRFILNADLTMQQDESCIIWYDITTAMWRVLTTAT
jgi:hypothetical protein